MENEPILLVGTDKMILRYAYHKPFKVYLPNKHEWQNSFNSSIRKVWSGIQIGPKPMKKMVLGCINGAQTRGTDSVLDSTPQDSRQKYVYHQEMHIGEHGKGLQREAHLYSL